MTFPVKGIRRLFTHYTFSKWHRKRPPIRPLIWGRKGKHAMKEKAYLVMQLFEVIKRFQMLEGKDGA